MPVYRVVSDETFHVDVVHPKYVRAPSGKKNDKRNAKRIAEMYMHDHIAEKSEAKRWEDNYNNLYRQHVQLKRSKGLDIE